MNRSPQTTIKLDWVQDVSFHVTVNRTVPIARRLPEPFIEPFYAAEEETWCSTTGFFM